METSQLPTMIPNGGLPRTSPAILGRPAAKAPSPWHLLLACLTALLVCPALSAPAAPPQPCPIDWSTAHQSQVNLSRLIEAPAGRHGFLRTRGSRILYPDGRRIRFWGVNLTGPQCFPTPPEATQLAAHLARMGVNLVRITNLNASPTHGILQIGPDTRPQLRAEYLDRLDYLLAQLKRHGIYSCLNLNPFPTNLLPQAAAQAAALYQPHLIELQHAFARQLLTHTNPYTSLEYRHDPAIALVELDPQGSLLEAWITGRLADQLLPNPTPIPANPASSAPDLTARYNDWLKQRLSPRELDRLRTETQVGPGGSVPRLTPSHFQQASRERFHTETRFYLELEQRYFEGIHTLLRKELQLQALLLGTPDHNHNYSAFPHLTSQLHLDLLHGEIRWHPTPEEPPAAIPRAPMVNDPLHSTVVRLARTPAARQPFLVSATHHPFPLDYAAEALPILTAYALLHDWDGITWSSWGCDRQATTTNGIRPDHPFQLHHHPVQLVNLQACALWWHRQDVAVARRTVARVYTPERLIESLRTQFPRPTPFFLEHFPLTAPLQHATRFHIGDTPRGQYPGTSPLDRIVSDRGQIAWHHADRNQGVVTVQTPRSQALIGFVQSAQLQTRNLSAQLETDFCALALTSLDDQPIHRSSRLLLTATGKLDPSGFTQPAHPPNVGRAGLDLPLVEPVIGTLALHNLGRVFSVRIRPLAPNGTTLLGTFEAREHANTWSFPIGEPAALWYRIDVQRRKTPP